MRKIRCSRCKREKVEELFAKRSTTKTGRQDYCIECGKRYHREWYARNKTQAKERVKVRSKEQRDAVREKVLCYLIGSPCVDCGEGDPVVLEFDHVVGKKAFNIGSALSGSYSWGTIEKEISKCVVRCANCHRRITAKRRGWFRYLQAK